MEEKEIWAIIGPEGRDAISFSGVLDASVTAGGSVLSNPTEKGGFSSYNKTDAPLEIKGTFAFCGGSDDIRRAIDVLGALKKSAALVRFLTPFYEYESMTLESFSYALKREDGRGVLYAELSLKEVRESASLRSGSFITPDDARNGESASEKFRGMVRVKAYADMYSKIAGARSAK